jgi:hypothetical protein
MLNLNFEALVEDDRDRTEFHAGGSGATDAGGEAVVWIQLRRDC